MAVKKELRQVFDAKQAAYATRLTLGSFYVKSCRLGIKGKREGRKVFFTRQQVMDIFKGISHK